MDVREREELELAVELAKNRQPQAAYFIVSRLREKNPQDNRVRVLAALTSPVPVEARTIFEAALRLDPNDPILAQAIEWMEKRPPGPPPPTNRNRPVPFTPVQPNATQTLEKPASGTTLLTRQPGLTAVAPLPQTAPEKHFEPETDDEPTVTIFKGAVKPRVSKKVKDKTPKPAREPKAVLKPLGLFWWLRLACSLLFFGAGLGMSYIIITANNLNPTEKAYAENVTRLTQKTVVVNAQLTNAITEFNLGQLDRSGLEKVLQKVIGLNDELRQFKSPSPRFDKMDGLLGDAYSYFNDGATNLINGLESGSTDDFTEGYRLFGLGNASLNQARAELKALGG